MTCRPAIACVVLALLFAAGVSAAPATTPSQPVVGTWQGNLPNGMGGQIRVVLHVTQEAAGLKATMDSPDQGAQTGIPVEKVAFEKQKLTLDVKAVGGSYEGTLDATKGEIAGTWRQSGQEIALTFKKGEATK